MGSVLRHKDPTFLEAGAPNPGSARAGCAQVSLTGGNLAETKDPSGCKAWGGGCKGQEDIVQTASSCTSAHLSIRRDAWKFEHRRDISFYFEIF